MGYDIYICYDEKDLSIAEEIVHLFEDNGIKCFFKERDMEGIIFDDYQDKLTSSKALLLILSNYANDSVYVKNDVDFAFSCEIPIITFKIDNCNLGLFEYFISFPLSIDAFPNYKDEFEYLLCISAKVLSIPLGNLQLPKQNKSIISKFKRRKSCEDISPSKNIKLKSIDFIGFTHDVFISYSSRNKGIADEICHALENNGIKCWIAPRNIHSGNPYTHIINAITNTKIVLWVFSTYSEQSNFCQKEIEIAINRKKPIISFHVDDTIPQWDIEPYSRIKHWISANPCPESINENLVNQIFEMMPEASILVPGEGRLPYPAYRGNDEYIFVSYAHKDGKVVFEEIRQFQNLGYNVWYDEGIGAGNEWLKDIIAHLKNSKMIVVFVTNNSMASVNVQKEIKYAVKHNKNIIPIYLEEYDDIEMEDDIDFELSVVPDIHKVDMSDEEYVSKAKELFTKYGF